MNDGRFKIISDASTWNRKCFQEVSKRALGRFGNRSKTAAGVTTSVQPRKSFSLMKLGRRSLPFVPEIALQRPFSLRTLASTSCRRVCDSAAIAVKRRHPRQLPPKKRTHFVTHFSHPRLKFRTI